MGCSETGLELLKAVISCQMGLDTDSLSKTFDRKGSLEMSLKSERMKELRLNF